MHLQETCCCWLHNFDSHVLTGHHRRQPASRIHTARPDQVTNWKTSKKWRSKKCREFTKKAQKSAQVTEAEGRLLCCAEGRRKAKVAIERRERRRQREEGQMQREEGAKPKARVPYACIDYEYTVYKPRSQPMSFQRTRWHLKWWRLFLLQKHLKEGKRFSSLKRCIWNCL